MNSHLAKLVICVKLIIIYISCNSICTLKTGSRSKFWYGPFIILANFSEVSSMCNVQYKDTFIIGVGMTIWQEHKQV